MESGNGVPVELLPSSMTTAGLLGQLDMSLQQPHHHRRQQSQQRQIFQHQQLQQQRHMQPFQQPLASDGDHGQTQLQIRHASYSPSFGAPLREHHQQQQQQPINSEEQPAGFVFGEASTEGNDVTRRGSALPQTLASPSRSSSPSPWHRMKWTDSMVRLLISVVYRVGDDGEQQPGHGSSAKSIKKSASASASALLQKKGKWKSVSQAMMEKGYYVSPQQCEDKFNDLNKRYKRVTDLLGKGTACRVVENQALLDTMDHLTPKAKEEARKLLNSKHLFFPEMCAYHNAGGGSANCAAPPPPQMLFPTSMANQQQCFHHLAGQGEAAAAKGAVEEEGMVEEDDDDLESEDDVDYDDEDDEEEDEEDHNHTSHREHHHQYKYREAEEDEDSKVTLKKPKTTASQHLLSSSASPPLSLSLSSPTSAMQQLRSELTAMSGGGEQHQRQWLSKRAAELEEQRVGYQCRAFQLERQRFKWLRFSTNKERQMERMKLDNDRLRLENDRMLLLLRKKELELVYGNGACANGGGLSSTTIPSAEQ